MHRSPIFSALLLLAACGPQGEPDIKLGNAWARPTAGQAPGAVYISIGNDGPREDRLVGALTDHAAMTMVHQNELVNGVARMRMAGEIRIPVGDQIDMVPGGTHIMLEGLRAPLKAGDEFELVLRFKEAGDRKVMVKVVKADAL